MKSKWYVLTLTMLALVFFAGCESTQNQTVRPASPRNQPSARWDNGDSQIEILSVAPNTAPGDSEAEFTVIVKYHLGVLATAEINFGVSNTALGSYSIQTQQVVKDKDGTASAKVRARPINVDEPKQGFVLCVNLSSFPHEHRWKPVAGDRFIVPVE